MVARRGLQTAKPPSRKEQPPDCPARGAVSLPLEGPAVSDPRPSASIRGAVSRRPADPNSPGERAKRLTLDALRRFDYRSYTTTVFRQFLAILRRCVDEGFEDEEIMVGVIAAAARPMPRRPGLIPYLIGQVSPPAPGAETASRLKAAETQDSSAWADQSAQFDALPAAERAQLLARARRENRLIAERPDDHPLIRAAAIELMAPGRVGQATRLSEVAAIQGECLPATPAGETPRAPRNESDPRSSASIRGAVSAAVPEAHP